MNVLQPLPRLFDHLISRDFELYGLREMVLKKALTLFCAGLWQQCNETEDFTRPWPAMRVTLLTTQ
jgi:hypothetical protein